MYNSFLLWRRLLFSLSAIFLGRYQMIQIQIYMLISILNLIYLMYYRPLDTLGSNRLELFNELMVLISGYHLLLFTGIQPLLDPGTSEEEVQGQSNIFGSPTDDPEEIPKPGFTHLQAVGWSIIDFSSLQITVNFAYILWCQYLLLRSFIKRWVSRFKKAKLSPDGTDRFTNLKIRKSKGGKKSIKIARKRKKTN
jgi:hypothetical protein